MREVYRARKIVKKNIKGKTFIMCDSIVYLTKNGRVIMDSEQDVLVLPRYKFNKKGEFWDNFYVNTRNQCWKEYKILEKVGEIA